MLSLLVSGGVSYVLAHHWLLDLTGWALFLRSALVGWIAVAVAVAGAGAGVIVLFGLAAVSDRGSKYGNIADSFGEAVLSFYLLPGFVLGIFIRATGIRVVATGRHVMAGLNYFAGNWRETVLVIDAVHPPALLPGAETVNKRFALAGLWKQPDRSRSDSTGEPTIKWFLKFVFSPMIYLPALIYRWNIKASSWLWGPVAFVLRPVAWGPEAMRSKTAFWTTWALQSVLLSGVLLGSAWLAMPYLPADLTADLPHGLQTWSAWWPAPELGVRYALLALTLVSLVALLWTAYRIRAAHAKALEGAGDFHNGYNEALKAEFTRLADPVRLLLRWNLAVMALTIWTFALWWSLKQWPNELDGVVWEWIRPFL